MANSNDHVKKKQMQKAIKNQKIYKFLHQHVPITKWLPKYNGKMAMGDMIAGITIGLTMIPQSIAYASLANLSPQVGLYSSLIGGFIYMNFGTVKQVSMGPTSLMALLTYEYTKNLTPQYVVLLTFMSGIVEMLMGLFKLGFLVDFISTPVTSGFTTATSIIVVMSQIKGILGVRFKGDTVKDILEKLIEHFHERRSGDMILGIGAIIVILSLRELRNVPAKGFLKNCLWFISLSRNTSVVLFAMFITYLFESSGTPLPYLTSDTAKTGLPSLQFPPFGYTSGNTTVTLSEMLYEIRSAIFIIPLVSVLANVSIAKTYANGGIVEATQEMLALGMCNIAGSFIMSMPTCGAFTRSALSQASGVQTTLSNIYASGLILLAILFLTPHFHLIPRAILSSILISAVLFMVDYQIIKPLWKTNRAELFVTLVTLLISLFFTVEIGLLAGICANIIHLALMWSRPKLKIELMKSKGVEFVLITPNNGLYFPAIDYLYREIMRIPKQEGYAKIPLVINCAHLKGLDYTAAKGLSLISSEIQAKDQRFIVLNASEKMRYVCRKSGCKSMVFCNSFDALPAAILGEQCKEKCILNSSSMKRNDTVVVDVPIMLAEVTPLLNIKPSNGNDAKVDL
ncbi:sodium-independent sulfate anion transporter-like isoform X2 [Aphis gossypii]|uniref:sodium-independent sulfate anion transporter-like isoform X2 n=1 Tax=Aphis gossypii TaxID=80765 RepID=UPI002158C7EF|nr:sodium-independent sulfate anion transporter-like isoform X2 [Aphis gossypii]